MLSISRSHAKPALLGFLLLLGGHSFAQSPFAYLGSYNTQGVPAYLEEKPDGIDSVLLKTIAAALPEQKAVPVHNAHYITQQAETEVKLTAETDVWVTFVAEGAGWKNTLGFYTYDLNNPPKTPEQIANLTVIFPNVSAAGSGGALAAGSKVKIGHFKANTAIGWFLVADGWRNNTVSQGNYLLYANAAFNPEPTAAQRAHTVLLQDKPGSKLILGFEDTRRDQGSDNDFNDVLFYITANALSAIQTENIVTAQPPAVPPVAVNTPPANDPPANQPGKTTGSTGTPQNTGTPVPGDQTVPQPNATTNHYNTTSTHNTTNNTTNNQSTNSNNVTTHHNNSTVNNTTNNTNTTTHTAHSNNVNSNNTTYNTTVIHNTTVVNAPGNPQPQSGGTYGRQPGNGRHPNGRTPGGYNRPGNNAPQNLPPRSNTPPAPAPAGCAGNGFSEKDFARTYTVIKSKPNEDVRQSTLQQAVRGRLLTVDQAVRLLRLLAVDANRLATAKYLYDYTCEKNNYFMVSQVLTVAAYERDFNAFLGRKTTVPAPTAYAPAADAPCPSPYQTASYAPNGFAEAEFEGLKSSVAQQRFTDTRMGIIQQAIRGRSLTTAQDIELIRLFSFEQDKVKLAKLLYDSTSDPQHYFKISSLFSFSTSVDELNQYLSTK